jgi:beta-lactamase regulating signal transducer with metallopeptidase domain
MNLINHFFASELIEAIGWTLVHSLWQGSAVVIVLAILLVIMRKNSAQLKYFVSFVSLIILLGWSVSTFVDAYRYAAEKRELKERIATSPDNFRLLLKQNMANTATAQTGNSELIDLKLIKIRSFFQRNFSIICTLWLAGMLFLFIRLIGSFIYLHRIRTYGLVNLSEDWLTKLNELAAKLKIRRKVDAFFSPLVKGPLTLGSIKPVILFPISAFTGLSTKEIEAILAHELAHVLRHDYFFNILQSMMEILFFYHPAVWIISAQIRAERENSCDNIAVSLTGDKVAYAKAIASAEIFRMEHERLAMAFASSKGNSLQRIKRLQKNVAMKTNFIEGLIAAGVIVIGLTLASFTLGHDEKPVVKSDTIAEMVKPVSSVEVDSILKATQENIGKTEDLDKANKELEKAIEAALSEEDKEAQAQMLEDINKAVQDLNIEKVVQEAMLEAQKAIKEASVEINKAEIKKEMEEARRDIEEARSELAESKAIDTDEISRDMAEARRDIENARAEVAEDFRRDMERATSDVEREGLRIGLQAATAGLDAAAAVMQNLPIEEIISSALSGVEVALDAMANINLDTIYEDETVHKDNLKQMNKDLKQQNKALIDQQKQLQNQQKALEKQMKALQKQLDSLSNVK